MKRRIAFITSHPMSVVAFLLPHVRALSRAYDVKVFANSSDSALLQKHGIDVTVEQMPIVRAIQPIFDLKALWLLYVKFRSFNFTAVHTVTPKAGLIGMAAAYFARIPVRVHSFTGQVWVTRRGPMRYFLRFTDKCIAAMSTHVLVDSPSQLGFLVNQGVINIHRSQVIGAGSICGVNTQRFSPNSNVRKIVRAELGSSGHALVCLYLGRLNHDKGVLDLASSFARIAHKHHNAELWIIGPDEGDFFGEMLNILKDFSCRVKRVGFTQHPERYMQAADLFCLPSYREGFGSSVIEAAACGVPALVSRIYGLTDAVLEGKTGWMHEPGNTQNLADLLDSLLSDPSELGLRGQAARLYANEHFSEVKITSAMLDFYEVRVHETIT